MTQISPSQLQHLSTLVDHTLLKPEARAQDILRLCEEAKTHGFASVCINPIFIPLAVKALEDSSIPVCTVVGFPLGASALAVKVAETKEALASGAREIDMVISIGNLKDRGAISVEEEVRALRDLGKDYVLKVIIETCLLTKEEIVLACQGAQAGGADFVKTSTGFSTGGALVEDIALMRKTVGQDMGVKASGGIRTAEAMQAMVDAGATRIGIGGAMAIFGNAASTGGY